MEPTHVRRVVRINTVKGRYRGKWQEMRSSPPLPGRRCYHSASVFENRLIVYGGQDFHEGVFNDMWVFNINPDSPSQERWHQIPCTENSPGYLCRHHSIVFNGSLYIFGGNDGSTENDKVFVLDLSQYTWRVVQGAVPAVDSYSIVLHESQMIIFGGYIGGNMSNEVFIFDLVRETWSNLSINGEKPVARADHRAVEYGGCMWVYGGKFDDENLEDLWKLDFGTSEWVQIQYNGTSPGPVSGHSALTYGDVMLLFGGIHDVLKETNEMYTYDFINNNWVLIQTETQIDDPVTPSEVETFSKKLKKMDHLEPHKLVLYNGPPSPMQGRVDGKIPHSRDGHTAVLFENLMIVFGGDRHQMAFNDLYCYSVYEKI